LQSLWERLRAPQLPRLSICQDDAAIGSNDDGAMWQCIQKLSQPVHLPASPAQEPADQPGHDDHSQQKQDKIQQPKIDD
jgi:hypothetical protein